jgi:hypothetical protein
MNAAADLQLTLLLRCGDTGDMSTAHILRNTWWWRLS